MMKNKMIKKLLIACLVLIVAGLGFGCSSPPPAEPPAAPPAPTEPAAPPATPEAPAASGTVIHLVGEQGYTPISFEKDGNVVGISPDIIREAFKRMGMEVKLELQPWKRCQESVQSGEADGFFSPYKTPEREKLYTFVPTPLMIEKQALAVKKNSPIVFDGEMKKMSKYTFGTLIGYATLEAFEKDGTLPKIDKSQSNEEAIKKLTSDRGVDVYVNTDLVVLYAAKQMGLADQIKVLDKPLSETPSYLAFTTKKDMKDLAAKFDAELLKMKADGSYDKILATYK